MVQSIITPYMPVATVPPAVICFLVAGSITSLAQSDTGGDPIDCPFERAIYRAQTSAGDYTIRLAPQTEAAVPVDLLEIDTPYGLTLTGEIGWSQGFSTAAAVAWASCADVRPLLQHADDRLFEASRCVEGNAELWTGSVHFFGIEAGRIVETEATGQAPAPSALMLSDFSVRLYYDLASVLKSPPAEHLSTDLFQLSGCQSSQQ
jgi:hypothetical protein